MAYGKGFWALALSDVEAWADLWWPTRRRDNALRRAVVAVRLLYSFAGLRASWVYRASHALYRRRIPMLPQMLWRLNIGLHGLDIPPVVPIGPRLYIPHPVGTVVMAASIGSGCTLVSGVTIGMRSEVRFPTLGDGVYVGAGARVLGGIRVGSGVRIGANAVLLRDAPDGSVAVGVPAKILPARAASEAAREPVWPDRDEVPARS